MNSGAGPMIVGFIVAGIIWTILANMISGCTGGPWKDHAEEPVVFIDKLPNNEMQVVSDKYKIYTFVDRADWFKIELRKPYRLWLQHRSDLIYDARLIAGDNAN